MECDLTFKSLTFSALGALLLAGSAAPGHAGTQVSNNLSNCRSGSGGTHALVRVIGFRQNSGRVRVQSYRGNTWLERGEWLHRVEVPVSGRNMTVCLPLPGPGVYGIGVRHDMNNNGETDRRDGGGYSGNPDLSLTNLRPSFSQVSFRAGRGVTNVTIVLNYLQGLSVEPI